MRFDDAAIILAARSEFVLDIPLLVAARALRLDFGGSRYTALAQMGRAHAGKDRNGALKFRLAELMQTMCKRKDTARFSRPSKWDSPSSPAARFRLLAPHLPACSYQDFAGGCD
jgi:hypothetical protein